MVTHPMLGVLSFFLGGETSRWPGLARLAAVRGPMQAEMSRQAVLIDVMLQETARAVAKLCYPGWSRSFGRG